MTLTPGRWLGLPAVTAVTLYRHEDPALVGSHLSHSDSRGSCGEGALSLCVLMCSVPGSWSDLQPACGEAAGAASVALSPVPGPQRDCSEDQTRRSFGENDFI